MASDSLTSKSAKNSVIALVFYIVNLVLQFISRKFFIEYLGEELLGLNTTISSILQFLNLAELGIGSAIGYILYKPLYENDRTAINEIVTLQGWLYRRIATFIIVASAILLLFFPMIFDKATLQPWYSYSTFAVLLFSSLLSYFVNYKQIVLSADQKEYKIQYSYKTCMLVKFILQIIFIKYSAHGYMWWLALEVFMAVVAAVALRLTVNKSYPYLKGSALSGKELLKKHPNVWIKTKQLFFHKIGGVVLARVSPIIIFSIATLELVAIYGNYMLIMSGVTSLIMAIFNSMNAGVGNLVARGQRKRILYVFEELFSIRFLITTVICLCAYTFTQPFMKIWMGPELLLDNKCLLLFVMIMFINLNRLTADAFINAYGLFQDIGSPIVESVLNITLSILFGRIWGVAGVLFGVFVSLFIVIFCWKQYMLYTKGFKESILNCVYMYAKHFIPAFLAYPVITYLYKWILPIEIDSLMMWSIHAVVYAMLATIILGLILFAFTSGMKYFMKRLTNIFKNVIKADN